ncbi:2-hydroxyacyl-CoA dehydratase [Methanococcus maripaludis]|uniref:2-hydroxyacyl-CoA dehydratase n=1 Tax=Methanococcus maripaludis TaxID=39152 RepID=UPI003C6D4F6A
MNESKEQIIKELSDSVVDMDEEKTEELSKKYLEHGYDAFEGITNGLAEGMNRAGVLYEEGEYFIPELLVCSDAMYVGLDILKPHLNYENSDNKFKAVVGVVYYTLQYCHTFNVEGALIEKELKNLGIPIIRIETDYSESDKEQIKTRLEAFVEMI